MSPFDRAPPPACEPRPGVCESSEAGTRRPHGAKMKALHAAPAGILAVESQRARAGGPRC